MASFHFSTLADQTGTGAIAESPQHKELLFRFLHDTGMSTSAFKNTHGLLSQDPTGFINDLKALQCISPEELSLWLQEFERSQSQNEEPGLQNSHKAAKRPRTHVEDGEAAATYESYAKCFPPGSAHLKLCKKSDRCTMIWKNTSTCFFSHFKKKHLSRYATQIGTYICPCGRQFAGADASDDILDHIWEDEMVDPSKLAPNSTKPPRAIPKQTRTVPSHSPRVRQGPSTGYEKKISFDDHPESHTTLATSDSGYNTPAPIPFLAAHNPTGVNAYSPPMDPQINTIQPQYQDPRDPYESGVFGYHTNYLFR